MKKSIGLLFGLLLILSCKSKNDSVDFSGTAWGPGAFESNGERIYFTATSEHGTPIRYSGFTLDNMMMMVQGNLACASCHGPHARGGAHKMNMHIMKTPDIRWKALSGEVELDKQGHDSESSHEHEHSHANYTIETFRMAVTEGKHPGGQPLSGEMPRWQIGEDDLNDLSDFLKSLP